MAVDFSCIGQLNYNANVQILHTHIIIIQIMINIVELQSIIFYKDEMDLKLYASTFKVLKYITICISWNFEIQFDYKFKYVA
jgi:hypothetical protein